MQEALYIQNSTIFVGYTFNHAAKTANIRHVSNSTHHLLLLYAFGHTLIIPHEQGKKPLYYQQIPFLNNHSSHYSLIKKNDHEQSPF
jgi:hypothetical protein